MRDCVVRVVEKVAPGARGAAERVRVQEVLPMLAFISFITSNLDFLCQSFVGFQPFDTNYLETKPGKCWSVLCSHAIIASSCPGTAN